jgi:cholinesterase
VDVYLTVRSIEKFGGDPKRMILHGQSAGGASVDYYSYAWTADPIIYGFIPQSGSASIRPSGQGNPEAAAASQWSALSDKLGCGTVTAQDIGKTLSCMKSKPLSVVMDATAPPKAGGSSLGSWGPKVDGKTVFADLTERGNTGKFIRAVRNRISVKRMHG